MATPIDVAQVQAGAEGFTDGLLRSFGLQGTVTSTVEGNEIEVRVDGHGDGLGLLIGPGGRTLLAVQDLARVATHAAPSITTPRRSVVLAAGSTPAGAG